MSNRHQSQCSSCAASGFSHWWDASQASPKCETDRKADVVPTKRRQTIITLPYSFFERGPNVWRNRSVDVCLGAQEITSESHPHWLLGKTSEDIGGPFSSYKMTTDGLPTPIHLSGGTSAGPLHWQSKGVLVPSAVASLLATSAYDSSAKILASCPPPADYNTLVMQGTTAIARCNPTSPVFDGSTAVAELVGGIPAIPMKSRNVGSEYLNYQFAISPTINDLQTLSSAAEKSEQIISQLESDSGKPVRRKYEYPEQLSSLTTTTEAFNAKILGMTPTAYEVGPGTVTKTTQTRSQSRFSGCFTYHLPPKGTWRGNIARLDAVYGVRPGFDTAWNALPFSWLADWYGNMGDVMKNLSDFGLDGNVLNYGYVTSHSERRVTYTGSVPVRLGPNYNNVWVTHPFAMSFYYTTIVRIPASPFGFGVTNTDLSGRQVAILAALGIAQV